MRKLLLILACALTLSLFGAPVAHADVNDFVIEKFDAEYVLTNDDPQGQLRVTEAIDVNFSDQNHGILRAIPEWYKKHRLQMDVRQILVDGDVAQWTTYGSGSNTVLKIGDPDRTLSGQHRYQIDYTLRNVISFYGDHDELYWDINGDQWQQVAEDVSLRLALPAGLRLSGQPLLCYAGPLGSTDQPCEINAGGNTIMAQTFKPLQGYETLTIAAGFEKGYFTPSTWRDTAGEYVAAATKFLVPVLLLGGTAWVHWRRHGRDPKGRRVIVPQYEAPDGLKAIEIGTIADFRTDNRDITATIIDLAIHGYVTIIETVHDRKILKDTKTYSLSLNKTDLTGLADFEKLLLRGIFTRMEQGEQVDLGALKYKLSTVARQLQQDLKHTLVTRGYLRETPLSTSLRFGGLLLAELIAMIILANMLSGAAVVLGIIAGVIIAFSFILLLPSRTLKGVTAREGLLGLKLYLEVAEKERIKKLQSPDAPYAAQHHEPKKTVKLFERLLPYAMILGVEEQWAKQFEHLYTTPPNWYHGNWTAFNAVYLTSALGSGVQSSVNAAFSPSSNSGGSGSSGGSSGGGGGGGGGGGW